MSWIRRHPVVTAVFAVIFVIFALAAIFAEIDPETEKRSDAILGLILIYLLLVGLYALAAWIYGKTFGRSKRDASMPSSPTAPPWTTFEIPGQRPPVPPQQMFPQWDWSAQTAATAPTAVTCWRCGAPNPPAAAFCDQCGARLVPTAPVAPPTGAIQCPRCQTLLSPQVRYCTNCGLPRQAS
jgi:hypothetical protein